MWEALPQYINEQLGGARIRLEDGGNGAGSILGSRASLVDGECEYPCDEALEDGGDVGSVCGDEVFCEAEEGVEGREVAGRGGRT